MKNILLASLMLLFVACSAKNETTENASTEAKISAAKTYACPMQCEGEKTYAHAGKCSVCKMELTEVAMAETDSAAHNH
jgi:Cu2+-exporting ATPase